jgi:hypothetical protein
MKAAYDINLKVASDDYKAKKLLAPKNLAKTTWDATVKELQNLPKAIEDESSYIKQPTAGGPQDAYALAFSPQITAGKGVPNLTTAQGRYITAMADAEIAEKKENLRREYATKPLIKSEVDVTEVRGGSRPKTTQRELVGQEKEAELDRLAREGIDKPFWTDPREVERRLKNPEKYTQPGVFTDETPFGTQQETNLGWLVRSAMSPWNAIAGASFPVLFTGADSETRAAVDEARRRARPQAYKDSPILLNIAEGRGFVGEAQEVSKITGLDTQKLVGPFSVGDLYTAGAFAADLLDPSLDIAAGAVAGTKVAKDILQTGKALKLEGAGKLAAKEGLKEAAKVTAFENPALNLVAKRAGVTPGDVRLVISDKIADDIISGKTGPGPTPGIVTEVEKQVKALDEFVAGADLKAVERTISNEQLVNALTEAYVRNPSIRAEINAIESAARAVRGKNVMTEARLDLLKNNPAIKQDVQNALIRQAVRKQVFAETKDSVLKSGLVALTRKTFATQDVASKVLKDVKSSDIGKLISEIKSQPANYTFATKEITSAAGQGINKTRIVVDGYKANPDVVKQVRKVAGDLAQRGALTPQEYAAISRTVTEESAFIPSDAFRAIIDATIDNAALKYSVAKGTDIRELTPLIAKDITRPLEVKDFANTGLRNWLIDKNLSRPKDALTPIQKAFVEDVVGKVSKLDNKLRVDIDRMLKNQEFRSVYGVASGEQLTRKEMVGHLIVGPKAPGTDVYTKRTLKLAMDKMFRADKYQQDIFDVFQGLKVDTLTDIWSIEGRKALDGLLDTATKNITANPSTYYDEMNKLVDEVAALTTNENNLKADIGIIKRPKGDISNELLISSYYTAESERTVREALDNIVRAEDGYLNVRYTNKLSTEAKKLVGSQEDFGEFVANYIKKVTTDPGFKNKAPIDQFAGMGGFAFNYLAPPRYIMEVVAEVTDAASIVLRNNGISEMGQPVEDIMKIVREASKRGGNISATMDAVLGKNVAEQIRSAISATGDANIQSNLSKLFSEAAESYMVGKVRLPPVKSWPGKLWNNFMSLFYTLVLTAAPRFHGANIVGAPGVVYSTTGKLISPLPIPGTSTYDSLRMLMDAGTAKGGRIVATDIAGRSYTADEVARILIERGGETVNAAQIPAVAARDALNAITEGKMGTAKRGVAGVLNTPQYEDQMFRGAIMLEALREGKPIDKAAELAKTALYDKGTITEGEAILARSVMFYSFTRNNLVNLFKNLTTVTGWKRIANVQKLKRGIEGQMLSDEERQYLPASTATRIVIGMAPGKGENQYVVALPGDSTLSAIDLLSNIIALDLAGIAQGMMTPGQSIFYKPSENRDIEMVPPEHAAFFSALDFEGNNDPSSIISLIAGEEVVPVRSTGPGNINGVIYPLLSDDARKRYTRTMNLLGYIGLGRLMTDYPNSLRASGGKVAQAYDANNLGYGLTAAFAAGALTPMKTLSAEQQRLKTLIIQDAEGKKMVGDIDKIMKEDKIAPFKKSDAEGITKRVESGKKRKAEAIMNIDELSREKLRLKKEIDKLKMEIRLDPARERRAPRIEQIKEKAARIREITKLQKEAEAAKK